MLLDAYTYSRVNADFYRPYTAGATASIAGPELVGKLLIARGLRSPC